MAECSYTVIDASGGDNSFLGSARATNPGAIEATSLANMIDQLIAAADRDKCCIKRLKIIGHGWAGGIVVGNGQYSNDATKRIDLSKAEWECDLRRLKPKLCPGAVIELFGCHVGADEAGARKLSEIADVTGATVTAPTGKVFGDGTKEKSPDQTARPGKPIPEAIPAPSRGKKCKKKGKSVPKDIKKIQKTPPSSLLVFSGMLPVPENLSEIPHFLHVTESRSIRFLLSQIDAERPRDVRQVGAAVNALLFGFSQTGEPTAGPFVILNEFGLIGIRGRWTEFCPISECGQEWLRQLAATSLNVLRNT